MGYKPMERATSAGDTGLNAGKDDELWPALQAPEPLSSLLSSAERKRSGDALPSGCIGTNEQRQFEPMKSETSTDRVNAAVGLAFDRLWRDRPGLQEAAPDDEHPSDAQFQCTVDGFITHYFRHVAELSRESVYQTHQRDMLRRMREDLVAGDRSGNLRELDAMIQRVDLDDRSLRAEIKSLMRIAETSRGPRELGPCVCCPNEGDYPPVMIDEPAATGNEIIDRTVADDPSMVSKRDAPAPSTSASACGEGRPVPACQPCTTQ